MLSKRWFILSLWNSGKRSGYEMGLVGLHCFIEGIEVWNFFLNLDLIVSFFKLREAEQYNDACTNCPAPPDILSWGKPKHGNATRKWR